MLIVGHGTYVDQNNMSTDYFILRNSYGADWGQNGYMYVAFDETELSDGVLGIQKEPQYF